MADNCLGITIGSDYDCLNPLTPGVDNTLILMNHEDIDIITYDITDTTTIADIGLKTGKAAFEFDGIRQSLNPQYFFVPASVSVGYDHQIDFLTFDISQAQKDNLESMGLAKLVAIVQNRNAVGNGNTFFEAYGLGVGMEMITNVRIPSDLETAGAFSISLKTSDNEGKEPKLPQTWFATDFNTTEALVQALLTPAP